jgi:hydroxyversicolorone monooxygenase
MAPDINTLASDPLANFATDGYADNGVPRSEYTIPDIVLHGPYTRKIKVLSIGAGVTGIMNAYHIQKHLKNVEHVIYEKNEDIGGTWLENRYPGAACDIPSHAYTFPFALNPEWPRFFSYSPDIWKYLDKVCEVWGLRKYMQFSTEVVGAYWQEEEGEWLVKLKESKNGETRLFDERCHVLLHGTGILNNFKWPDIEGIETFKGKVCQPIPSGHASPFRIQY